MIVLLGFYFQCIVTQTCMDDGSVHEAIIITDGIPKHWATCYHYYRWNFL